MSTVSNFAQEYLTKFYMPSIAWTDIIEILLMAAVIYNVLVWIKDTKAWALLKGIIVVVGFAIVAYLLNLRTILWIAGKTISVGIIALVIIFQPELRRALEQLGRKRVWFGFLSVGDSHRGERYSTKTINEILRAVYEMGAVKTGALIVIEQDMMLEEYIRTGIEVDGIVTSQLLINIFEHNTPLHDGAVIVRGNRITSATCYLPLSDSTSLSKELGTRHRAGVGISEATDSLTIVVSEQTGKVSVAYMGQLYRGLTPEEVKEKIGMIQNKTTEEDKKHKKRKGKKGNEEKTYK